MLFKPRHIPLIRKGKKTATRRDWKDGHARPNVGTVHMATTEMFTPRDECDCFIRILDVYQEPLGEMDDEDARKEGGYTLSDFRAAWEQINGEGSWDPETEVDVVEFEYAGRQPPVDEPEAVIDWLTDLVDSEGDLVLELDRPESTAWAWWEPLNGLRMHAEADDGSSAAGGGFSYFNLRRWAEDPDVDARIVPRPDKPGVA